MSWTQTQIEEMRRRVVDELSALKGQGAKKIITYIVSEIAKLASESEKESDLRRVLLILMALSHQSHMNILKRVQVRELTDMAFGLLDLHGVRDRTSRLAWLRSDLHLLMSQCFRRGGDHDDALWEHFQALAVGESKIPGGEGFQNLILGTRLLRLGHVQQALIKFHLAQEMRVPASSAEHLQLAFLQSYLMVPQLQFSQQEIARRLKSVFFADLTAEARTEFQWLKSVFEFHQDHRLPPLLSMVKSGKPHYQGAYLLDAIMYGLAFGSSEEIDELPRITYLKRVKKLAIHKLGAWAEAVGVVASLYDRDIPLQVRTRQLRRSFAARRSFITIDKELLFVAAAYQWSRRSRIKTVTEYLAIEIESLSLRLSGGASSDVWGVLGEYAVGKSWKAVS